MAKLFKTEGKNEKSGNVIKTVFLLLALFALTASAVVYYWKSEGKNPQAEPLIGVHVKGAVENSGYYEVPYGTRVKDLEEIVGGFSEDADLDGVNLASYVKDGDEVYFPRRAKSENGGVNLNTADEAALRELDGVGEDTARKIIAYREEHGGFESVLELKDLLGDAKYNALREKVFAK